MISQFQRECQKGIPNYTTLIDTGANIDSLPCNVCQGDIAHLTIENSIHIQNSYDCNKLNETM